MKKLPAALLSAALLFCMTSCKTQTIIMETTEAAPSAPVTDNVTAKARETTHPATTVPDTTVKPESEQKTTQPSETQPPVTEVDLSISLPEENGTMKVDKSPSNKYTSAVASERKIDTSLLVAVFSVPESGQNYVFEFKSADFTADNLRRVYLLGSDCRVTGVAAADSKEKEGMSSTENWFCMNVLIKGVIFPEIKEQF